MEEIYSSGLYKKNDKLILVSSHCDTPEKLKILKTNLEIYKEIGTPVLLYSSNKLDVSITDIVDYYFYNSNNPIDKEPGLFFFKEEICSDKKIRFERYWSNHNYSVFHQIKYLVYLAKLLDYDLNFFVLYDLVITSQIIHFISKKNDESFFSFFAKENGIVLTNDCSTQLFSISREKLTLFQNHFIWENTKNFSCLEHFFSDLSKKLDIEINREFLVEDHIYTFRNWKESFYNYSPWIDFKIYFSKNESNILGKCLIYHVTRPLEIFLRINTEVTKIDIFDLHEFIIDDQHKKFEFWFDGKIFDVLENFRKFPGGGWILI
jgi:hypothetical protein